MIVQTQSWQKVTKFYRDRTEKNPFFRPQVRLASLAVFRLSPFKPISLRLLSSPTERVARQQSSCGRRQTLFVWRQRSASRSLP